MKKHLIIAFAACLVAAATVTFIQVNKHRMTLAYENIEALTDEESYQRRGRYRTVGCGSYDMIDWRPYCCPHELYDTCPSNIDPSECRLSISQIFGCE